MPNAKDAKLKPQTLILNLGDTGSGKTTLLATYPGKVFAYLFDPNALRSLKGFDIEYEEFLPDVLSLDIKSLKKERGVSKGDKFASERKVDKAQESETYSNWEKDFYQRLDDGYFEDFDCIAIDSGTTFQDAIMDRLLFINGRPGQFPQEDDWPSQMVTFSNTMRLLTSLGLDIYVTGHCELKQDILKRIINQPLMTGRLKTKIPLLFSEIWHSESETDNKGNQHYKIRTMPDQRNPVIRCSIRGLQAVEDVTIDFQQPLHTQGLGRLLAHEHDPDKKIKEKPAVITTG